MSVTGDEGVGRRTAESSWPFYYPSHAIRILLPFLPRGWRDFSLLFACVASMKEGREGEGVTDCGLPRMMIPLQRLPSASEDLNRPTAASRNSRLAAACCTPENNPLAVRGED